MFELFSTILAQSQTAPSEGTSKVLTPTVLLGILLVGAALVLAITWRIRTVHLALGFATTVLMWAVGYLAMLAPGMWIGEALFSVTLCIPVAFGWIARRGGASPAKVGLVSALANLLVIGAFLRDEQQGSALTPVLYVVGLFAVSTALAVFGGFLASHFASDLSRHLSRHLSRKFAQPIALPSTVGLLAIVAAVAVFLLLVTGGLVTSLESGLAVPDWPNSFGHNMLLYPISQMKGGIYYEHAHRLFGMLVGVTALVMLGVVWREDSRRLVRMLAIAFIVIVCAQGLLGGLRVTGNITSATSGTELRPSTLLAIVHGMFGQIVFATACVIACIASTSWKSTTPAVAVADAGRVRALPIMLLCALLVQLFLGASYRHLQVPPHDGLPAQHPSWPIWCHIAGAIVVLVLAVITGALAGSRARNIKPVRILGKGLVHAVGLQVALGVGALVVVLIRVDEKIPGYEVLVTSAHQAIGALLLAMTAMLAALSLRFVAEPASAAALTSMKHSSA
jgi:cytochrome c oxidase assembly protein subunit 15